MVKVKYCGICGSDLHAYESGYFPPGVTIGHEFSGFVAAAGPGCEHWITGNPVTGNNNTPCSKCPICLEGFDNLCPEMRRLGIADQGALAEYILVPSVSLYSLPENVSMQEAALAEPVSVGLHAVNLSDCQPEQTALIIGGGTIGLIVLALLKQRGIKTVAVIEPDPKRAALAAALGASSVINPDKNQLHAAVKSFSGSQGPKLVFECAGIPETISAACNLISTRGTIIMLGICHQPVEINFLGLVTREISIIPSFSKTTAEFVKAVELITSGKLNLSPLISKVISLDELDEGFNASAAKYLKILVSP